MICKAENEVCMQVRNDIASVTAKMYIEKMILPRYCLVYENRSLTTPGVCFGI